MIQMNDKKSRKFFSYHVFGVLFIRRDSNKAFIQIQKIKERFEMILKVIFAIVLICLSADLEEKRPLQGECEWYQLCQNGRFVATRCPTYGTGKRQMFNLITGNCAENKKLPIDGQCQLYRQCLVVESVSPFGKWYTVSCESGQHFDQEIQNCIPSNISTCGKFYGF